MRLDNVRILDLTQLLPGPYGTQLLADCGADVIRVEDAESGDPVRYEEPRTERGVSGVFDGTNRGKRSIGIDLKSEAGRNVFFNLAAEADVIFEQFRPGVVDRLGVDYDSVREHNDSIIYCSLTGYGQEGPYADRAGHDLNYVSLVGLTDMTRADPDSPPQLPGYPIADLAGGLFSAFSIVSALLSRELGNTGGEYIDVAMTDVVASFSQPMAHEALTDGDPRPGQTALTGLFPWYDVYECADGRYISIGALERRFWEAFCEAVDREDLIEYHRREDEEARAKVREELETLFLELTRDEWIEELPDETMVAPVLTPAESVQHPQLRTRVIEDPEDAPARVGFPAESTAHATPDPSVPDHGEHTDEVLTEAGYDAESIESLRDREIIR
jgi:crotonobetainyl-CoA:carnitine CoA-transferase CaiB-like acyl-CoA transferase